MRWLAGLILIAAVGAWAAYWWLAPADRGTLSPTGDIAALLDQVGAEDAPPGPDATPAERGEYVLAAAGCAGCHTRQDGAPLAGGPALETPFGTFFGPNITPDPDQGIGAWSQADLALALRQGLAPDGSAYYPVLPYTHYAGMSDGDIADLWAYLQSVDPADEPNRPHDLSFPYSIRLALTPWRWLYFQPGGAALDAAAPETWQRGAYLVETLGHCGACHTPRGPLGALDHGRAFAGADNPVGDGSNPNITPSEDGLAGWSVGDLTLLLEIGMSPSGDFVGGEMGTVVRNSTSLLAASDREAIAVYLLSLEPRAAED